MGSCLRHGEDAEKQIILDSSRVSPFDGGDSQRIVIRAVTEAARADTQRVDLVKAIIEELLRCRFELPAYSTLIRETEEVGSAGDTDLVAMIDNRPIILPRNPTVRLPVWVMSEAVGAWVRISSAGGGNAIEQERFPPLGSSVTCSLSSESWPRVLFKTLSTRTELVP